MIDRKPAFIVRCTGVADVITAVHFARGHGLADVITAVHFARDHGLLVAVRGGGHNVAGTAVWDGGMVIDLSPMRGLRGDPRACTARAQAGLLWGEFDHETQAFGLATPGGIVTHTGIAGLTLGGGIGWLMCKHGLTCDNLLSADVVTADGQFLHASAQEHPDLFWGLCGGGGNFGIVTSFKYRLHPVGPRLLAGVVLHPAERAHEALRFYRDYITAAPDELTTIVNLRKAPPAPFLPAHLHGLPVVIIAACYASGIAEGERVLAPRGAEGPPLVDLIRPTPYTAHQGMFDASVPHGLRYYWKSEYLQALSDGALDTLVAHAWQAPSPTSYTIMFQLGGAIRRVAGDAAAFADRRAHHTLNINGVWSDPQATDAHIQWTRAFWAAMRPFSTGRVYVNFLGDDGEDRVREAYGAVKYARLVALKNAYDPTKAKIKFESVLSGFLTEFNGKYKLRVTELILEPGGYVGEHNHVGPGIRLVTSGTMTYVLPDKTMVYGPGEFFFESGDVNHTAYNKTEAPMVHLLFEILPADLKGPSLMPVKAK